MSIPFPARQLGLALAATVAIGASLPCQAQAMWVREGWRPVRWVAAPYYRPAYRPSLVAAPVYAAPRPVPLVRGWVPGHYNRVGGWVPGHWR